MTYPNGLTCDTVRIYSGPATWVGSEFHLSVESVTVLSGQPIPDMMPYAMPGWTHLVQTSLYRHDGTWESWAGLYNAAGYGLLDVHVHHPDHPRVVLIRGAERRAAR